MIITNEAKKRYFSESYFRDCFKDYLDLDLEMLNRLVNKIDWYTVYWIKHKTLHNDVNTQGYVGITSEIKSRLKIHLLEAGNRVLKSEFNRYGFDSFECVILHSNCNAFTAYNLEYSYRPYSNIGYNKKPGGTMNSRFICYPVTPGQKYPYSTKSIIDARVKAMTYIMNEKVERWVSL